MNVVRSSYSCTHWDQAVVDSKDFRVVQFSCFLQNLRASDRNFKISNLMTTTLLEVKFTYVHWEPLLNVVLCPTACCTNWRKVFAVVIVVVVVFVDNTIADGCNEQERVGNWKWKWNSVLSGVCWGPEERRGFIGIWCLGGNSRGRRPVAKRKMRGERRAGGYMQPRSFVRSYMYDIKLAVRRWLWHTSWSVVPLGKYKRCDIIWIATGRYHRCVIPFGYRKMASGRSSSMMGAACS